MTLINKINFFKLNEGGYVIGKKGFAEKTKAFRPITWVKEGKSGVLETLLQKSFILVHACEGRNGELRKLLKQWTKISKTFPLLHVRYGRPDLMNSILEVRP